MFDAALSGHAVILADRRLTQADESAGRLVGLHPRTVTRPQGLFLVTQTRQPDPSLEAFAEWLRAEAGLALSMSSHAKIAARSPSSLGAGGRVLGSPMSDSLIGFPAAMTNRPSAAWNVSNGVIEGWRAPVGCGGVPVVVIATACSRMANWLSSMAKATFWPLSV